MVRVMSYGLMMAVLALAGTFAMADTVEKQPDDVVLPASAAKLTFNENGEAALPKGYRSWVHAYTAWQSIDVTPLNNTVTKTPEFHSVYVEPNAYRAFMKTGRWPEGSLMVKEFNITSIDPKNCGGPPAYVCDVGGSKVIFPHGATGLSLMLKDSKRYPNEPGGWSYFSFGYQAPPYEQFSPAQARAQCAQCHIDNVGPKHDYVWSVKLNQPGLQREGDAAKHNLDAAFAE
ncbi:hypothetical protein B8A54_19975 [Pseudomonas aeruginosa]|nr:hypothetical protein B8A54_19975 [Pseudomonas aeruginosa]